jgi:hypothetical protein
MKRLIQISATVAAVAALATTLWAAGDYLAVRPIIKREFVQVQAQVEQLSQAMLRVQFENLMRKREYGGLTFDEQQTLCRIAKALGYVGVPRC